MKKTPPIKIDPEVADVRRWRDKVWKQAGESFEGLMERARRFETASPSKPERPKRSRKGK